MAFLSAAPASMRSFRFGASPASSFATWRRAKSQSGCLTYGSLLTSQRRQSATHHRQLVACPPAGNSNHVPRHLSTCHHQVGRASFGARRREIARPRANQHRAKSLEIKSREQPCIGQASIHAARSPCSQRPRLRAPA